MLFFRKGENRSTRKKTSRSKGENQQEITYTAVKKKRKFGNRNFFQSLSATAKVISLPAMIFTTFTTNSVIA